MLCHLQPSWLIVVRVCLCPCLQDIGSWNLQRARFLVGTKLPSWAVVAFGLRGGDLDSLPRFLDVSALPGDSCP